MAAGIHLYIDDGEEEIGSIVRVIVYLLLSFLQQGRGEREEEE